MGLEAKKFATYEDLLNVPDHLIGEIIDGKLITRHRRRKNRTKVIHALRHALCQSQAKHISKKSVVAITAATLAQLIFRILLRPHVNRRVGDSSNLDLRG